MEGILIQVGIVALTAISTGVGLAAYSYRRGKEIGKMELTHTIDSLRLEFTKTVGEIMTAIELNIQSIRSNAKRINDDSGQLKTIARGQTAIMLKIERIEALINGKRK